MQSAQKIANPFANFPIEVLMVMFSWLSPEQIALSASVNKQFEITIADNFLWEEKLKKHFPNIYNKIERTNDVNWYAEFCRTYEEEYRAYDKEEKVYIALPTNIKKLFSLVKEGDVTSLEDVLKLKDLDQTDVNGISLLDWAKKKNNQALLNCFYNMALKEYKLDEYLHWAILCHQSATTIKKLIGEGADINVLINGHNALRLAAEQGQAEIVELLITQYSANIDATSPAGASAIMFAIEHGHKNVVDVLLKRNVNLTLALQTNAPYHQKFNVTVGDTPLHVAIKQGKKDIVEALLEKGADINVLINGHNALRLAAEQGQAEIVELLITQYSANIDATSPAGASAIMFAIEHGHKNVVDVLLKHHVNLTLALQTNTPYHQKFNVTVGDTPLHVAIKQGKKDIVEALLEKGADINVLIKGHNALRLAAEQGQAEIVELLITQYSANIDATSPAGASAIMFAIEHGHKNVVDVLLKHHVNLTLALQANTPYHQKFNVTAGDTPLHVASKLGSTAIIARLINKNANIEATNNQNQTPVDVAIQNTRYANELKLLDYLAKVEQRIQTEPRQGKHHKKSFTILGCTFDFGFSAQGKKDAAEALKRVIFDGADKSCLNTHQGALNNGDLKSINRSLRIK